MPQALSCHMTSLNPRFPLPSRLYRRRRLTLNGRLGAHGRHGAHGANHKVRVDEVLVGRRLAGIVAEVGHARGAGLALEGALVGRVGTGGRRAQAADGSSGGASCGAGAASATRDGAGGCREGRHSFLSLGLSFFGFVDRRNGGGKTNKNK